MVSALMRGRVGRIAMVLVAAGLVAGCVSVRDESASPPSSPATATVDFLSKPGDAEVYVDGRFRGTTYVRLSLPAGDYEIEMRLAGFETWTRTLTVVAGDATNVTATLEPAVDE